MIKNTHSWSSKNINYSEKLTGKSETLWFWTICFSACSKDVRLPVQLQRAMAAEAEAAREARAKVIAAEGEQKASRALREASEVISDSSSALQLRYLQVKF